MSRLPIATREQFPATLRYVWDAVAVNGAPPNIFRALGNNPELLRAYLRLGNGLWRHCGLDLKTRELVILRTAIHRQSRYEWHQHVRIARDAGIADARINALHDWANSTLFDDGERAILAYVDAVQSGGAPPRSVHDQLARHVDAATLTGICLLTAFYAMTATFLAAMEVEPETAFVGWTL